MPRRLARSAALAALLASALPQLAGAQGVESARAAREGQGVVLGLAALAAIGILLHERREDREEEREKRARRVPDQCLVAWPTRDGSATLYDPDCLDQAFAAASRLPLDCAVTVRSGGRFVSGFSPACLREEGWDTGD